MRKVFWCCVAAGAAVCCGFGAAAYVSWNPDAPAGRVALAVCNAGSRAGGLPTAALSGRGAAAEGDGLIPPDPVPVEEPPTPTPGAAIPAAVEALFTPPPIVIHDEEDPAPAVTTAAKPAAATAPSVDADAVAAATPAGANTPSEDGAEVKRPAGPPVMPYCPDDAVAAPRMPYCDDAEAPPAMPPAGAAAADREFNTFAFWKSFFSGPARMFDAAAGRCEEDGHYTEQYPGVPFTARACPAEAPARADLKPLPALPGAEETGEPPAPKADRHTDPQDLFSHPRRLQMPRPEEPQSDTMEMRPSDWKPYSLDPGVF